VAWEWVGCELNLLNEFLCHGMNKELAWIAVAAFTLCLPAKAVKIIYAECNNGIRGTLSISDRQVSVTGSASAFNLESFIQLNGIKKEGYTAILYGGQSKYFSSYDGTTSFNATVGHGESRQLSTAELGTKTGRYSCILK